MLFIRTCKVGFFAFAIMILSTSMVNAASLSTLFATNNGASGNTFDLSNIGASSITINSFEVNISNDSTIDVYTTPGTSVGVENTAASWTLLGSAAVISNGTNVATPVGVGGLVIAPGQSFGIYIHSSAGINYTNGAMVFDDGTLQITTNTGEGSPAFTGGSFFPRQWNGTVIYTAGIVAPIVPTEVPTLSEWALIFLILSLGILGFNISRRKSI